MFKVAQKFGRSENFLKEFSKESEAQDFIIEKLKEDRRSAMNATYCLYEWLELIREYSQSDIPEGSDIKEEEGSHQQKGSSQSFNPSPFNTAPRMPGVPHSWIREEDDKKKSE